MLPELQHSIRALLRSPGFTCTAILTLALGIGANSAVFTVLSSVVLKPLPFPEPDRILRIRGHNELRGWTNGYVTMPDVADFRDQSTKLAHVAGYGDGVWILTGRGPAIALKGAGVTLDFFAVLGVEPRIGRSFTSEEFEAGHDNAVVLSDSVWRRLFNADPHALNRIVTLDGEQRQIVGIMPPTFQFPESAEIWSPTASDRNIAHGRTFATTRAIARLKNGATAADAQIELGMIASRIANEHPASHDRFSVDVTPLADDQTGDARAILQLFLGAVACVLLIACSNVANLMLARATGRSRELAIRAAMGATAGRLLIQTAVESLVLSLVGAVLGLGLAFVALRVLVAASASFVPRASEIRLDPLAVAYTVGVALLTSVLFAALPAFLIAKTDAQKALGDRSVVVSGASNRAKTVLVVSQFALATVLACSAGLLVKTFQKLIQTDPGYRSRQVLTAGVTLTDRSYQLDVQKAYRFYRDAIVAIGQIPGVEHVGAVTAAPLGSSELHIQVARPGVNRKVASAVVGASIGYHEAMSIPLRSGRYFDWGDWAGTRFPVILSESLVKQLFGTEDPIGRQVQLSDANKMEVIGVVGDIRANAMDDGPEAQLYLPLERSTMRFATFAIRSSLPPNRLIEAVRDAVARVDANVPLVNVRTMEEATDRSRAGPRFRTILLSAFAGAALLLAVIGIYGLLSYMVEQRYRELGVRIALGATTFAVARLIIGQGLRLAAIGIAIGLVIAFVLGQVLGGLIYGIEPLDPEVAAIAAALFILVALAASIAPAIRAAGADPQEVLRCN